MKDEEGQATRGTAIIIIDRSQVATDQSNLPALAHALAPIFIVRLYLVSDPISSCFRPIHKIVITLAQTPHFVE
jgi:hypothetical protein